MHKFCALQTNDYNDLFSNIFRYNVRRKCFYTAFNLKGGF